MFLLRNLPCKFLHIGSKILEVHVTLPKSAKKNKYLCTKHPFPLCDNYGHYPHHCPYLEYFCDTLQMLHELDVAHSDSTSPLPGGSCSTSFLEQEVSQPTIIIPPLDFKMADSSTPIIYMLSSMGLIYLDSLGVSYCDSFEPSLEGTLVSTSLDVSSTSHLFTHYNDTYVKLVSQEEALSTSSSCGLSSSSPHIFHSNEDIMEAITTPDYPCDSIHHHVYFFLQNGEEKWD